MGTILIDKLLSACVTQNASDLNITVGQVPLARIGGQLQMLAPQFLQTADVESIAESITPDRCQQELRQNGQTYFNFGFGDVARVCAHIGRHRGQLCMQLHLG